MDDLISRRALYERAATLEAQALDYVEKLIERDGEETSVEWRIWSAILAERTAFKHDVFDAPSAQRTGRWIPVSERLPEDGTWNIFTDGKQVSIERYKMDAIDHFFPAGRFFELEDAVAWMPLPEPYKEEQE